MSSLEDLPLELQYEILMKLPGETLLNLCQTNSYYREICEREDLWKYKFMLDYGDIEKPPDYTWREQYKRYIFSRLIPIFVNGLYSTSTHRVFRDENVEDVIKRLNLIHQRQVYEIYDFNGLLMSGDEPAIGIYEIKIYEDDGIFDADERRIHPPHSADILRNLRNLMNEFMLNRRNGSTGRTIQVVARVDRTRSRRLTEKDLGLPSRRDRYKRR